MAHRFRTLFLCVSAALYATFLLLDLTGAADSTPVKFAAILLCFFSSLLCLQTADGRLTAAALAGAVCADWFLLLPGHSYPVGVLLFCVVQAAYALRLCHIQGKQFRPALPLRLLPLLLFALPLPKLAALSLFYFANLAANVREALRAAAHSGAARLFAVGLLLLMCCDLCVGAVQLGLLTGFTGIGMWLFYLPSQVCIVLSAEPKGKNL
ncbi:lysoplasmalogenase family protein [Agathobaculum desmolans]|uniref:lysoplasmalogenase family protein n=1 Tax=Agathobaculum desmolans TaxID=39484 RepID=UPI0004E169F3|nr:lysoplasmalogenase family protein [Agathobaculum desmolans]